MSVVTTFVISVAKERRHEFFFLTWDPHEGQRLNRDERNDAALSIYFRRSTALFPTPLSTLWVAGSCVGKSLVIIADIYWTPAILSTLYVLTHLIPMTTTWISRVQILTPPLPCGRKLCNFTVLGELKLPNLRVGVSMKRKSICNWR